VPESEQAVIPSPHGGGGFRVLTRPRVFTDVQTHEDRLDQPLRWKRPRRIFVNSMSDLFHEDVPDAFIDRVFAVMAHCPQHTFQVLTKRAERMRAYMRCDDAKELEISTGVVPWPLPNVWLGVSGENQRFLFERARELARTPAAVRFVSLEPLLEDVAPELRTWLVTRLFHWVIVGGESGLGARPMDLAWARSIIAQCKASGIACFVKQLGARPESIVDRISFRGSKTPKPDGFYRQLNDSKGGAMEEWPTDLRVREYPDDQGRLR
jgi:protein gp37